MRIRNGLLAAAVLSIGNAIASTAPAQSTSEILPTTAPSSIDQSVPSPAMPPPPPALDIPNIPTTVPGGGPPGSAGATPVLRIPNIPSAAATTQGPSTLSIAPPVPTTDEQPVPEESAPTGRLGKVVVTSDLDVARSQIAPSLGATTYTQGPEQIQSIPGGANAPFQQVLLRAPGVVEDSFGQEHVRGEHANLTYRVNGVLLPEPLSGFGQELDTRLIQSLTLIDGALPAQFGFHTAGIVDVTTKSGETLNHNEFSLYGGSFDTIQPSVQFGGTSGKFDYFVVASSNHNGIGIENTIGTHRPIHDYTDQQRLFAYIAYRPDDTSRISLLANASYADFELPDTRGLSPGFTLASNPTADSSKIDENQNEQEYYTVLAYQKTAGKLSLQLSAFTRYGQINFRPDQTQDLLFQGVASSVYNNFVTTGAQFDSSYILDDEHTIRAGFLADYTYEKLNTNTGVFAIDPTTGNQASSVPANIVDNSNNNATESGVYLQDEWRLTPQFTVNYGVRYDRFDSNFDSESQLSPRANLVWKIDDQTTAHVGYARYFVPPPVQNVGVATVQKFANTTNASENLLADPPKVERSHYFDLGISRQITKPLQVGIDGFYKLSHNLVDLGQFGSALIETPFNYKVGKVYGAELSTAYKEGGLSLFGNGGWVETRAHDIDSQQFQIGNAELAYISNNDVKLDHEAEFAGSAGASYEWRNDRVYVDWLFATGLRSGFANTGQVPPHYPVNIGYEHIFRPNGHNGNALRWRVDVVNIFDEKYELRNGSGIGVGAAQFGERLGFFTGITYEF